MRDHFKTSITIVAMILMPFVALGLALPPSRAAVGQAGQAKSLPRISKATVATRKKHVEPAPPTVPVADTKQLKKIDRKYQKAKSVAMKVDKTLKIGLLGEERKSSGTLWLSTGKLRMELEGNEKSVLVVNKRSLWAVTYPGPEFPDAPVQVIKGDSSTKKGQSKNIMSLLTVGGFLKFFKATAVAVSPGGEKVFTLAPKKDQTDFKRAEVTLGADGLAIAELKYWDQRDNETSFIFHDVTFDPKEAFGKKVDAKLFDFSPPANAEVMNL